MKKKTIILFSILLVSVFILGSCASDDNLTLPKEHDSADLPAIASPGPAPNNDATIVVMVVNGIEVTKDEFNSAYSSICEQYGIPEDDTTYQAMIQQSVIEILLSEKIVLSKIQELGYMELSDEELEQAQQKMQEQLDYVSISAISTIMADLPEDYTEEDLDTAIKEYEDMVLAQYGWTRESFLQIFIEEIATDNAMADLLKDVVPTDEEVNAQYENSVEADKDIIGDDLSVYDDYYSSYTEPYYIPEGIRYVRHILLTIDSELSSEIRTLRSDEDDEAADEKLAEALALIQETADEVLAKLQNSEITFTEAIEQYNEDPGMETNTDGYEVYEGCSVWMPEFTEGALALENVGDISGLVPTDYGYHIIEYTSDREAGPIPFESVQQEIYDSLLVTLQDEAWQALKDEWRAAAVYTVYNELL